MFLGVQCFAASLLTLVAVVGDYLVSHSKLQLYRAIFDNVTHAIIGGLSWFIVCLNFKNRHSTQTLYEIITCTVLASFIDLDHFIAARSLRLKNATMLTSRPVFHCSTFPLLTAVFLLYLAYFIQMAWLKKVSLILFTAFASHHTRDAFRRGYWFFPFGSTPPIPYFLYVFLTVAIPYIVCFAMKYVTTDRISNKVVII